MRICTHSHKCFIVLAASRVTGLLILERKDIVVWDLVAETGLARLQGHVDAITDLCFWEATVAP